MTAAIILGACALISFVVFMITVWGGQPVAVLFAVLTILLAGLAGAAYADARDNGAVMVVVDGEAVCKQIPGAVWNSDPSACIKDNKVVFSK